MTAMAPRLPQNRARVAAGALDFVDQHGLAALSMRKLGAELGVEAMSLYNHVANKDDLLDAVGDLLYRDVLAGLLVGGRATVLVGPAAATVAVSIGVSIGALAGFFGMDFAAFLSDADGLALPDCVGARSVAPPSNRSCMSSLRSINRLRRR